MVLIEHIYENYYRDVYRFVLSLCKNHHVAEDITQETFLKAMKSIDSFKGKSDIKVWLFQIAKNSYLTFAKRENRFVELDETIANEQVNDFDFEKNMIDQEQAMKIHQILHNLSEPYKEVFTLRVFGELSFKQIASLYGKTESWARVTYHRARIMIMDEMK